MTIVRLCSCLWTGCCSTPLPAGVPMAIWREGTGLCVSVAEVEFRQLTLQVIGEALLSLSAEECDAVFPELYLPIMEEVFVAVYSCPPGQSVTARVRACVRACVRLSCDARTFSGFDEHCGSSPGAAKRRSVVRLTHCRLPNSIRTPV